MATLVGLRIGGVLAASVVGVMMASAPALAAQSKGKKNAAPPREPPMRVYIVRSAATGCEPNCPEWIAAQGQIEEGSPARFRKILSQLGDRKLPVLIHSGGGAADAALAIGRLLRGKGLDVGVSQTDFTPCAPEAAACRKKQGKSPLLGVASSNTAICASSCAFVLAAGTRRFVGISAFVGVHRLATIQTKVLRTYRMNPYRTREGAVRYKRSLVSEKIVGRRQISAPQKIYGRFEKYFAEMNITKDIMPLIKETANSSIHWLTLGELRSTRIATHRLDGNHLLFGVAILGDGWTSMAPGMTFGREASPQASCERFGGSPMGCSLHFDNGLPPSGLGGDAPDGTQPAAPAW